MSFAAHVMEIASSLLGEQPKDDGVHPEYQRAILEMTVEMSGLSQDDDGPTVARVLGIDYKALYEPVPPTDAKTLTKALIEEPPIDAETVRAWAKSKGLGVNATGRISKRIYEAYLRDNRS